MKYKLLKEIPGAKVGEIIEDYKNVYSMSKFPDFFDPIVENKTVHDMKNMDRCFIINRYGNVDGTIFDDSVNFLCASNRFLTREEAEDEHKRREWSCRKGKFIPDIEKYYYCYNPRNPQTSNIQSFKNRRDEMDILIINSGLAFRSEIECIEAIKENDLIRLFYTIK